LARGDGFSRGDKIESKETIQDIFNDWDSQKVVTGSDIIFNELAKSEVIRSEFRSEMVVEFLAKHAPDIPEETFKDVEDLMRFTNLKDVDSKTIEWILETELAGETLYNNTQLINALLSSKPQWLAYFNKLRTYGNGLLEDNKLNQDTATQIILHTIDEYGSNPYDVFSQKTNRDLLLRNDNYLNDSPQSNHNTKNHNGWLNHSSASNAPNYGISASYENINNFTTNITNRRAARFIKDFHEVRKIILNGKYGRQDNPYDIAEFVDCSSLDVDNFWNLTGIDYELLKNVYSKYRSNDAYDASSSVSLSGDNLVLKSDYNVKTSTPTIGISTDAYVTTHPIDVSGFDKIEFDLDGFTQSDSMWNGNSTDSTVFVRLGSEKAEWTAGSNPSPTTINISNVNKGELELKAIASTYNGVMSTGEVSYAARSSLTVKDISLY